MNHHVDYEVVLDAVTSGYDRVTCWTQARAGVIPPSTAVLTMQKLRLTGCDVFYAINSVQSDDLGATWSEPVPQRNLGRRSHPDGTESVPNDYTPAWHAATAKLLATGHCAFYRDDDLVMTHYPRRVTYSVYDADACEWGDWRIVEMPDENKFYECGSGCAQRWDLPGGEILLPFTFLSREDVGETRWQNNTRASVMRARFDGQTLSYVEHGTELAVAESRGFAEPSLAAFSGRYFLTLRNDVRGYVAVGDDGLRYDEPVPWTFDDGEDLGNYNTQQHWIVRNDALFLVYTRRGLDNDHVFRHRAPLVMAEVDPDRLCVIRETERVIVPERGARLGNFGALNVSVDESWVIAAEWMQTTGPDAYDFTKCERCGSDNTVFLARILWNKPNRLASI